MLCNGNSTYSFRRTYAPNASFKTPIGTRDTTVTDCTQLACPLSNVETPCKACILVSDTGVSKELRLRTSRAGEKYTGEMMCSMHLIKSGKYNFNINSRDSRLIQSVRGPAEDRGPRIRESLGLPFESKMSVDFKTPSVRHSASWCSAPTKMLRYPHRTRHTCSDLMISCVAPEA